MKKAKLINFLQEDKKEDKLFTCVVLILIYLLVFQGISYMKSINNLQEEISDIKITTEKQDNNVDIKNSTLLCDMKEVYDLLEVSNIDSIYMDNNKVAIEGKCKDLKVLDKLKKIKNVKDVSVDSIQKKKNKYLFKVVYQIGGAK